MQAEDDCSGRNSGERDNSLVSGGESATCGQSQNGEAPFRPPLSWKEPDFWDEEKLLSEMERIFDICHGCRRCLNLCDAFPTLFELVDGSGTMEMDGVAKRDYWKVVDTCYLCDRCYAIRCPFVPPHEWAVDFPQLMLRARAVRHRSRGVSFRERLLASPDGIGRLAAIPGVVRIISAVVGRAAAHGRLHLPRESALPPFHRDTLRKRCRRLISPSAGIPEVDGGVVLFATCYGNFNAPDLGGDLIAVFEHNGIPVVLTETERCCGRLRLELGDLDAVARAKAVDIPVLAGWAERGWHIVAPLPSCVQMFRQWLPLMFPDDPQVQKVRNAIAEPFEYLVRQFEAGKLRADFKHPLGVVLLHLSCFSSERDVSSETRDILSLVPGTHVETMAGCIGAGGGCGSGSGRCDMPLAAGEHLLGRIRQVMPDHYGSGCPRAGRQIEMGLANGSRAEHPLTLLRLAYGI